MPKRHEVASEAPGSDEPGVSMPVTLPDISRPPSAFDVAFDRAFRAATLFAAWATVLLVVYVVWDIGRVAEPAIASYGTQLLTDGAWDANRGRFVPSGILAAIYVAELGPDTKIAFAVRLAAKLLTGLPSILAGVFAFAAVVFATGGFSAPAGGVALALLMLPTVLLTAEEAIKRVPSRMREAAIGMGATQTQVVTRVILPTAAPNILTGIMLAVARAAGETAPLLFTALFSEFWISGGSPEALPKSMSDLMKPTASLAVLIYNFSGSPFQNQIDLAWTAALVLVVLVLVVNLFGQSLAGRGDVR